jgi:hypothetical protein
MQSSNYEVGILCGSDGAVKEQNDGVVPLPYNSEYRIRLVNHDNKGCTAKVFIDGENLAWVVLNGGEILDLERPTLDGKRNKFKFVSLDSRAAKDAGKCENSDYSKGVVRVEFYPEKESKPVEHHHHFYNRYVPWRPDPWDYRYGPPNYFIGGPLNPESVMAMSYNKSEKLEPGCTVEGTRSNQEFVSSHLDVESQPVIITIVLKGYHVSNSAAALYCDNCGSSNHRKTAKYCSDCGEKLPQNKSHIIPPPTKITPLKPVLYTKGEKPRSV